MATLLLHLIQPSRGSAESNLSPSHWIFFKLTHYAAYSLIASLTIKVVVYTFYSFVNDIRISVANRPTDQDRPLRSVGLGFSRLPVCRSRSEWHEQPGRSRSDSPVPIFYRPTEMNFNLLFWVHKHQLLHYKPSHQPVLL